MACVLCLASVPNTSGRRRLYGVSSSLCLHSLRELSSAVGLNDIIPGESDTPFLCLSCFKSLEKYAKVKANFQQLQQDLTTKVKSTATALNITSQAETGADSTPGTN